MDRDRSLERRYSFNASLRNPAAESTKLNHSTVNRSGLGSSFKWNTSPISPKQRCNSSVNLINLESTIGGDGLDRSRCSRSVRKIDPRIVADVQSKGLASRIVKYHENGNRLNRSMSAHNLYTKPGQFPVVTLKKTDLPYRATKQNVSMTRIAPPEKSAFYGSTLSSLLRSNSIVGLHKSDEDISRENRPIIHPPPTENDMAPTRSVLDVLKEISRKRINSDDSDVLETSKKNKIGNDLVDTGAQTMMTQSFKRQRDLNSPHNGDVLTPTKYNDTRFSPEQAKKRVCNYNNDITSSLSSSMKRRPNVNKRPSYQLNQTMPTSLESYEMQKNKTPKCDGRITNTDIRCDNLESTTSKVVTPNVATTSSAPDGNLYGAIPPRSKSEPIPYECARTIVPNNKPRLTLFNKAYEVANNDSSENAEEEDNLDESGDCAGIQFVKPKKLSSTGLKNPVIERAQKSKLALMLSGLRGELYVDSDNDELDAPKQQKPEQKTDDNKNVQDNKKSDNIVGITSAPIAALPNTSTAMSVTPAKAITAASKLPEKADTANNKPQFTMKAPTSGSSPLVGLKLTPPTTAANAVTTQTTQVTQSVSTPTLQGFAFGAAASSATPATTFNTPTTTAVTQGAALSFGTTFAAKTAPSSSASQNNNLSKTSTTTVQNATQSFGMAATTTATALATGNTFSFSSANGIQPSTGISTNSSVLTATIAPITTQTAAVMTPASSAALPASSSSTNASTMFTNSFSFGANTATSAAPAQSQTFGIKPVATTAPTATFSFGSLTNPPTSSAAPTAKSAGGFSLPTTTTSAAPAAGGNTQFNFGSAAAPNTSAPAGGNAFSFGSSSTDKPSAFNTAPTFNSVAETNKPAFGVPASATTTAPVFGSAATTTASSIFGSSNAPAPSMFGSTATAAKTTFGSSEANKPSASLFGGPPATNSTLPAVNFGQPNAIKTASVVKPTPSTGGFSFGSSTAAAPAAGGSFTFGGSNTTSNMNSSSTAPAPAAPAKTFSFGAATNAPEKNNTTNIFGGSASSAATNSSSGGFTFGSSAPTAAAPKPSATFAFGAPNANSTAAGNSSLSSAGGGFSFGAAMQPKANDTTAAKPFSFGSSASTSNQQMATNTSNNTAATNMFAANMMNKPAAPAFNFGGAAPTPTPQATVAPAAANNIFALPATMAAAPGSGDRPIRRATRRLQK